MSIQLNSRVSEISEMLLHVHIPCFEMQIVSSLVVSHNAMFISVPLWHRDAIMSTASI